MVASPKERERAPASAGAGPGRVVSSSKQCRGEDEELLRKVIRGGEEREKLLMDVSFPRFVFGAVILVSCVFLWAFSLMFCCWMQRSFIAPWNVRENWGFRV